MMATWLEKAKKYRSRQDAAVEALEQAARDVGSQLEVLRGRLRTLCVWALLPVGAEISEGQAVWYLGSWYVARKQLKKVLTEPPEVGDDWEEWSLK